MSQQWYLSRDGTQYGPYTWQELQNLAQQGNVDPNDLIWSNSLGNWTDAQNVPNLLRTYAQKPQNGIVNHKNPRKLRFSIRPRIFFMPYGRVTTFIILLFIAIAVIIAFLNGDLGSIQIM